MSSGDAEKFGFHCPKCGHRFFVAATAVKPPITCPACHEVFQPRSTSSQLRSADKRMVLTENEEASSLEQPTRDFDATLQEANAVHRSPEQPSTTQPPPSQRNPSAEFRYACKVCGTAMYAQSSEVGKPARCPDCHSAMTVPPPPSTKGRSAPPIDLHAHPEIPLQPVGPSRKEVAQPGRSPIDDYLARAERELAEEKTKNREITYDFDSAGWLQRSFSLLLDPSLIVISLGTGGLLGLVMIFSHLAQVYLAVRSESAGALGYALVMILGGAPLLAATLANGIAILEASANRLKRVARWPIFSPAETLGETGVILAAVAFAALPGGLGGWLLSSVNVDQAVGIGLVLFTAWLLFPVLLLSMLDNQSITQPFSRDVLSSIRSRTDAWGAAYLQSAIVLFGLFLAFLVSRNGSSTIRFLFGMSLPFAIYFLFNQYGVLASRIADLTHLELESDDDQESEED